jgi:hypothetical protein
MAFQWSDFGGCSSSATATTKKAWLHGLWPIGLLKAGKRHEIALKSEESTL